MNTVLVFCSLYVIFIALIVIADILHSVQCQFKGIHYEWYSIKTIKEKREWWKWLIGIGAFIAGIYYLIPNSIIGKADFRSDREKPEYTAYYECEYSIENFDSGRGYISIKRADGTLYAEYLFTSDGKLHLDLALDDDLKDRSYIRDSIAKDYYAKIDIGEGPLDQDSLDLKYWDIQLPQNPVECDACWEVFEGDYSYSVEGQYFCPDCIYNAFDYARSPSVWKCERCCAFYNGSDTALIGLCPDCEFEYGRQCANCGSYAEVLGASDNDFALCDFCLALTLYDPEMRQAILDFLSK